MGIKYVCYEKQTSGYLIFLVCKIGLYGDNKIDCFGLYSRHFLKKKLWQDL